MLQYIADFQFEILVSRYFTVQLVWKSGGFLT